MGINVAVTGLNATDNPAPGIGVIRSLRRPDGWDGKIIGLAYDVYDTGVYDKEFLDHTYLIPYPNQSSKEILDRLLYIHSEVRIDVIIPTLDSELVLFQRLEPALKEANINMYIPSEEIVRKRSKANLIEFCREHSIPTPRTAVINNPGILKETLEDIGFPLYIKGVFYDAYRCQNIEEAVKSFELLRKQWGLPILVQETLDGEEFDVCAVGDREGNLLGAIPIRKLRFTEKGKAWAAITIKNTVLHDLTRKILKALKWAGPCEVEIMQNSRTKEPNLLEINPRFPAWIFLGTGVDQNLPKIIVDLALGRNVDPLPEARAGVSFVRHATDLICDLEYIENLTVNGELHYNLMKED